MSTSLKTAHSQHSVKDPSSNEQNQPSSMDITKKYVRIAIRAGRLGERIIALLSSPTRSFHGNMPSVVRDTDIYSNKKLTAYVKLDQTVTYRYVVKEFAIYGTTAQECEQVYDLYQSLSKTDQGKLIQQLMKEDMKNGKLFLFGHPGTRINRQFGVFGQRVMGGNLLDKAIIVPLNKPRIAREFHWSHEAGHYLVSRLTNDGSTCPLKDLPLSIQSDFMNKYHDIRARFLENPHPPGTSHWKLHEHLKIHLFEKPITLYPSNRHASEIAAFTLEFELAFPGFLKKYGVGDLEVALHDLLYKQRPLPKMILDHVPLPNTFAENTHTVSLAQLNANRELPMSLNVFKHVGNGLKKAWRVVNHPYTGLAIEICFNYKPGEERALLKAIKDGTAIWVIGSTMTSMMLYTMGAPFTITFSVASMVAENTPDFSKAADSLPTAEELINSLGSDNLTAYGKIVLHDQINETRVGLKLMGALQNGLKALNPQRIWQKIKPKSGSTSEKKPNTEVDLKQLEDFVVQELKPYLTFDNSPDFSFSNPANLILVPELTFDLTTAPVSQPDFKNCQLIWQTATNSETGLATVETSLEIPRSSLESVVDLANEMDIALTDGLDVEISENPLAIRSNIPLHSVDKEEIKKPSFGELSKITDIRIGAGIGGGIGLTISLASGAEVSLAATETGLVVGTSVQLTSGLMTALGTGLLYAAPIAAVLIGVQQVIKAHEKKVMKHLKEDNKNSVKEMGQVKDALAICSDFFEKFKNGEINKEEFLEKVNQTSNLLSNSSHKMGRRGRYSENHKKFSFEYFSQKTRLEQIDLDLRAMTQDILAKHEVDIGYAPGIRVKPLDHLYSDLQALADKKVISIHEKYQQEALKKEISLRIQNEGDLDALSKVEVFIQRPAALCLEPSGVAKPRHISIKQIKGGSDERKERRKKKIESWANSLAWTYSKFCEEAKNYKSIEDLEKASKDVKDQIARTEGEHSVNLAKYKIRGHGTALDYYSGFICAIKNNVETTLDRAKAIEKGDVSDVAKPLFSSEELNILKFKMSLKIFDQASDCLHDDSLSLSKKNIAFTEMIKAGKILTDLSHLAEKPEELKQVINPVLKIADQYDSYENYVNTIDRLEVIKTHIEGLQAITQKENGIEKKKSQDELKKELEIAYGHARKLIDLEVNQEDIEKLTGRPEDAEKTKEQVLENAKAICDAYTIQKYESKMSHIYTPATRLLIHVLGDFNRFDGYEKLKLPVRMLSIAHSFAPDLLPTGLTLPIAFWNGDGQVMKGALHDKAKNVYKSSIEAVRHPVTTWKKAKTLHKKSNLLQSANVTVQMVASFVTASSEKMFGDNQRVKHVNASIQFTASSFNTASNVVYYTHLGSKFYKYCKTGTLGLKMHKIGSGLGGLTLSGFDLYEFMASDLELSQNQQEWGYSDSFKKAMKDYLPNFNGNLPESAYYYGGRDCFLTTMYGLMGKSPVTLGLTIYQGVSSIYNLWSGKYEDDALCSIMLNFRYNNNRPQTQEVKKSLSSSIKNLKYYLQSSFVVSDSDSKVKKSARAFYFEHHLNNLENDGNTTEIIRLTALRFHQGSCSYPEAKIEVFDAINLVFKRFGAILKRCSSDADYCIEHFEEIAEEFSKIEDYFNKKFGEMPKKEQEKNQESFSSMLESIKRIRFGHKIIYLEKVEKEDQILDETELIWDTALTSCTFKATDIEVVDCLDIFFKRCKAVHKKVCDDAHNAIKYTLHTLIEIEKVTEYLDKKAVTLNAPNYLKEVREELKHNTKTTFLSCYCVYYIKGELGHSSTPLEALQMFDRIPKRDRNVLHWYALGCVFGEFTEHYRKASDSLETQMTDQNELIFDLTSLQRSCFTIILTILEEKQKAKKELSDFDNQLYKNSLQILENLKHILPAVSKFSQITTDTDVNFYDLLQSLIDD